MQDCWSIVKRVVNGPSKTTCLAKFLSNFMDLIVLLYKHVSQSQFFHKAVSQSQIVFKAKKVSICLHNLEWQLNVLEPCIKNTLKSRSCNWRIPNVSGWQRKTLVSLSHRVSHLPFTSHSQWCKPSHDILLGTARLPVPLLIHTNLAFLDCLEEQPWRQSAHGFHPHSQNIQEETQPEKKWNYQYSLFYFFLGYELSFILTIWAVTVFSLLL